MKGSNSLAHRVYWKHLIANSSIPFELTKDFVTSSEINQFDSIPILLNKKTSDELRYFGKDKDLSIFTILLACTNLMFGKYGNRSDVLLFVPSLGSAPKPEILPLSCSIDDQWSFKELVVQTQNDLIGVYTHQEFEGKPPFEKSTILVSMDEIHEIYNDCNAEVVFQFFVDDSKIRGNLKFKTGLFRKDIIRKLSQQFSYLISELLENRSRPLHELNYVSMEEKRALRNFNRFYSVYPKENTIAELFQETVIKYPENIALIEKGNELSYLSLNKKSNQIAHFLREVGVKPNDFVGVFMERGIDFVVSVIGVLKSGAAYLPVDPVYPSDRIEYMVRDSKMSTVLTKSRYINGISRKEAENNLERILVLDGNSEPSELLSGQKVSIFREEDLLQRSMDDPSTVSRSEDLAYMIYTSGSTGRPKGAMIRNDGALNHMYAEFELLNFTEHTRFLQSAPSSSDISVWQMIGPLLTGGTSVIVGTDIVSDPEELFKVIKSQNISLIELVPIVFNGLMEYAVTLDKREQKLPSLSCAMVTGEEAKVSLVNRWLELYQNVPIVNAYGPTEAADDICQEAIKEPLDNNLIRVPIGKPISNMHIYILDQEQRELPIGFPGEICVSGVGVGSGYWENKEKTKLSFITNPFTTDPEHNVLYKTGDLGRFLPDGTIEFLERIDRQIKIRGFRIEPGEIEAVLIKYKDIDEVFIVDQIHDNNKLLVAYYKAKKEIDNSVLKTYLKEFFSQHMIPNVFILLEDIPLLPNGKVDKKRLVFTKDNLQSTIQYVKPSTNSERKIEGIWEKLLKLDKIGVNDNFFDLGGHSFLVIKLINEVESAFGVKIALANFLTEPTILNLARLVEENDYDFEANSSDLKENILQDILVSDKLITGWVDFSNVFLTGATGILGVNLLYELLKTTKADIYCLVRAKSKVEGLERLINKLKTHRLWDMSFKERLKPVIGDLEESRFGLESDLYQNLSSKLDVIFHNGAMVNFAYPYSALKRANIDGTKEILALATLNKLKPVHYVSSLSVFDNYKYGPTISENSELLLDDSLLKDLGYTQTKWVADRVMNEARKKGVPINIYRPDTISGNSKTGIWNTTDFACKSLRNMALVSIIPKIPLKFNWIPVDYVSRTIVHLARKPQGINKNYHVVSPHYLKMNDIIKWIRPLGYEVTKLSFGSWKRQMLNLQNKNKELDEITEEIFEAAKNYNPKKVHRFSQQNTINALEGTNIYCPPIDKDLVKKYFEYFEDSGFLSLKDVVPYKDVKSKGYKFFYNIFRTKKEYQGKLIENSKVGN